MANTASAKKAMRGSAKKREHNTFWKRRISAASKNLIKLLADGKANADILKESLSTLQKVVDKAVKAKVIHKNKAGRIKSKYANRIAARASSTKSEKPAAKKTTAKKPAAKKS